MFDIGSFILGLIIVVTGIVLMRFYQPIADSFGIVSYEKYKMGILIAIVLGTLIMFNLHVLIIKAVISIFPRL